ncbi:phage tail assembly chaperone [Sphingomicrobium aestuariivivum]|uniref:phage tail assembly chaperone n=1 Tax=Sphingomicrobium aestuariivivum TaxID=1582356 RepID=UPI001FD6C5D1|nr:phage tail assembly chaperone [Sphingomicrobium aestuariivivum]MCJ8191779.1 phage tail assembly chaperone [Sphingomicrobium aestuariivivum]
MSQFAGRAGALYALAAQILHWPPDVFWNATPEELASALGVGADTRGMDGSLIAGLRDMINKEEGDDGRRA